MFKLHNLIPELFDTGDIYRTSATHLHNNRNKGKCKYGASQSKYTPAMCRKLRAERGVGPCPARLFKRRSKQNIPFVKDYPG